MQWESRLRKGRGQRSSRLRRIGHVRRRYAVAWAEEVRGRGDVSREKGIAPAIFRDDACLPAKKGAVPRRKECRRAGRRGAPMFPPAPYSVRE